MTPRRPIEGRTPCDSPPYPAAFLLGDWESYLTPSQPKYTKIPQQTGGKSYILIEKSTKTAFYE
jgi:hypothetical protein